MEFKIMNSVRIGISMIAFLAFASTSALAADVAWTGEDDNVWTNAANWAGGVVPTGDDAAVFASDGVIEVKVQDKDILPKTVKVLSGTLSLTLHTATFAYLSFGNNMEGIIDVAEGAVFSNSCARIEKKGLSIVKRGKGRWVNGERICCDGGCKPLVSMKVEEGILELMGQNGNMTTDLMEIAPGAKCIVSSGRSVSFVTGLSLVVDGVMELTDAATLTVASLTGTGKIVGNGTNSPIRFENADGCNIGASICGNSPVIFGSPSVNGAVTIADFRKSGGSVSLYAPFTVLDGNASLNFDSFLFFRPVPLTIEGGTISGTFGYSDDENRLRSTPIPGGCLFRGVNNNVTTDVHIVQNGGTVHHGEYWRPAERQWNSLANRYDINGGTLVIAANNLRPNLIATAESPSVYALNGGRIAINLAAKGKSFSNGILAEDVECLGRTHIAVGEKGGRLGGVNVDEKALPWVKFNWPIVAEAGVSDGGVSIVDGVEYVFSRPVGISGGIRVEDGGLGLDAAADTATTPQFFGSGAVTLRNAPFSFVSCMEDKALKMGELRFDGAAYLRLRRGGVNESGMSVSGSCAAQTLSIGSVVREGPGSALFVTDGIATSLGDSGSSKVLVQSAPALRQSGVTALPIFAVREYSLDFMTYDSVAGLVPYSGYVGLGSSTTEESIALATDNFTVADGTEKTVGGFRFGGEWKSGWINGRLNVRGTGTMLLQSRCNLLGSGTVDFGDREGLIVFGPGGWLSWNATISATIVGSGGMSFVSTPDCNYGWRRITLSGANRWTGGTRINSVRLQLDSAEALGDGDVAVGGGTRNGGRLAFNASGATFTNRFTVSGSGCRDTHWDGYSGGAMEFLANTELTGDVRLEELSRWTAPISGVTATVMGTVSGDSIEVVSTNVAHAGVLRFDGHNTYAGGTEVVRSVFAVKEGDGAGTGPIFLDNSVLMFCNDVNPIAVENKIGGTNSVIRLTGPGEVDIARIGDESVTLSLDLAARATAIGSLAGFSQVTTARAGTTHLVVGDGDFSFAGTIPPNVVLHRPGEFIGTPLRIIIR